VLLRVLLTCWKLLVALLPMPDTEDTITVPMRARLLKTG
jgi:hypothetical protein